MSFVDLLSNSFKFNVYVKEANLKWSLETCFQEQKLKKYPSNLHNKRT